MSSPARSPCEEPLIKQTSPVLPQRPQQSTPFSSLNDDLLLSCFARISRLYYPTLSLVSNKFPSLLSSPELYKTRSLLGRTESCLYVCLQLHDPKHNPNPNPRWFTLSQKPNRTKEKTSSGKLLVPIPSSSEAHCGRVVSLGSSMYTISGPMYGSPSSDVWVLDCRCHAWRKAPSMRVERAYHAAVNVFDGKIYVAGGCETCKPSSWRCQDCKSSSNWMEVFDPKTQTWEPVLCRLPVLCPLLANIRNNIKLNSTVIEGRIYYMFESTTLAYHPKEDKWEAIRERMGGLGSCCVIDKVLYCGSVSQGLKWYDTKKHNWVNIKGLEVLPKFTSYDSVKLADYGGTLAVFSKNMYYVSKETRVWCAVIVFERRGNDEIWGTVEWFDTVLTVPNFYSLVCAL